MRKIISLFLICLLILTGCEGKNYTTIDYDEAITLIDNGAVVIDVRNPDEFESGHISGAQNITVDEIDTINYSKDTVIILYCATGTRSGKAAKTLADNGYTKIYNLDGGLLNWGEDLVK